MPRYALIALGKRSIMVEEWRPLVIMACANIKKPSRPFDFEHAFSGVKANGIWVCYTNREN